MGHTERRGPTTEISSPKIDRITVRGADLCSEIIGHESFSAYFLRLLGIEADKTLVTLVDATMVSIAEHGFVPSVQAARMTHAAAPDALQGAVAAGLLGCGSVVLGASETAGVFLDQIVRQAAGSGESIEDTAKAALQQLRAGKKALPGFGHPLHKPEDPRAWRLIEVARELGSDGAHVAALVAVHKAVPDVYGRHLPLNVSGAIPAVLLDAGFPIGALKGIPLIARTASLVAHLLEEQHTPIGFTLSDAAAATVTYVGMPSVRDRDAGEGA